MTAAGTARGSNPGVPPWLVFLVVGLFVAAAVYILQRTPDRNARDRQAADLANHDAAAHGGDGLSDRHDGYLLSPAGLPDRRGAAVPLTFRIIGPGGAPTTSYQPLLGVPLHLYVLREDLGHYQHLHPTLAGDTWTASISVPDGGVYRLYAEFVPINAAGSQHPTVLSLPFVIAGDTSNLPLPAPASTVDLGGLTVNRLEGTADAAAGRPGVMRFQVLDANRAPVTTLEPYVGTYAHASVFDVATQRLIHLHPVAPANPHGAPPDGVLTFHTEFPQRGRYRLFLQFKAAGAVHQAAFTVQAT